MGDFYIEQLVKRKNTIGIHMKKAAMIALIVLCAAASVFFLAVIPAVIILIVVTVILFKRMDVEYEYQYCNGELDIDKIMSKESRKRVFATDVKEMEVIAPTGSIEVHQYCKLKAYDFSSREAGCKTYEMVVNHKGQKVKLIFEPNEELLKNMKMLAPRKVFF